MPIPGEGGAAVRPRRKTPEKLTRAPRTESVTVFGPNGQEVTYYPEEFPGDELFQPGEIFYAAASGRSEPTAWEYLGRTADMSQQAVFVRWDSASDDKAVPIEVITRNHKTLGSFRSGRIPVEEIDEDKLSAQER